MITPDNTAEASDFIYESEADATPANDEGRVPKLEADGKLSTFFLRRKFGGDGSDGALSISSGATNIDLGGAKIFIKQYSSMSITGTGYLTFTNPSANGTLIIFKVQGDVTITSSATRAIDLRGLGGVGAVGGDINISSEASDGLGIGCAYPEAGSRTKIAASTLSNTDMNGAISASARTGRGARLSSTTALLGALFCAAGGQAGAGNNNSGKSGGRGAGGLLIQCNGDLNITGTIDATGGVGTDSTGSGGSGVYGMGGRGGGANTDSAWPAWGSSGSNVVNCGGGGGGGCVIILYNGTLTANTATITVTGGAPGATGNGQAGTAGADGYSLVAKNTELL